MRIAICHAFAHSCGGVESYLSLAIPALRNAGHEVAALFEQEAPADHARFSSVEHTWVVSEIGRVDALRQLRRWRPDVAYIHKISDPSLEQDIVDTCEAVHFMHDYDATCISGRKAFAFPHMQTCERAFGWQCLFNYFPRRCGGKSPLTMSKNYWLAKDRLKMRSYYGRVLVASEVMRGECLRNGIPAKQVEIVHYPIIESPLSREINLKARSSGGLGSGAASWEPNFAHRHPLSHLLFAGRMVSAKGGSILLEALPQAAAELARPLLVTMAGDGPSRPQWEEQARILAARTHLVGVEFVGWLDQSQLRELFEACDLLAIPSLWPEPFGLIGPEAGMRGLPAVAFDVGGISEWLHDGVNGLIARSDRTAAALATVIARCLSDPDRYRQLSDGARREAKKFGMQEHIDRLLGILHEVTTGASALQSAAGVVVKDTSAGE